MGTRLETCVVKNSKDTNARAFLRLPFDIYKGNNNWVPWFDNDIRIIMDKKHPYFEHSFADFFVVKRGLETVGRITLLENTRYNREHGTKTAHFYFWDLYEDKDTADRLFEIAFDWAKKRNLSSVAGPLLFGGYTGSGILVDGFRHRCAMNMMNYNHPYYKDFLEGAGFTKMLDLHSSSLEPDKFQLPDRMRKVAEIVLKRGHFKV
ncbi:MAG: hypothetical protein AB1798_21780, partial [Spirochaetota bacterium]